MAGPTGLTRRELFRLAGGAGASVWLAGCTKTASSPTSSPTSASRSPSGLGSLSARLSAPLLRPGSPGYASHVQLYNPRFDSTRHPAAIAACRTPRDVQECVRFAAETTRPLHLRAGGHSYGGWSSGPGLVADVTAMSHISVDTAAGTARIGAGAQLARVYDVLASHGVAIAAGSCPTVGLTGLALGGGVGVLTRAFGLTCDALRSVQMVTADGVLREVDARHQPDLFWALRGGGGGSFGAVTALTLRVQPAPTVHTYYLAWSDTEAEGVLTAWQRWIATNDRRLWSTCKLLVDGGQGVMRVVVAGTWVGASTDLDGQLASLLSAVGAPPTSQQSLTLTYAQAMLLEAGCSGDSVDQCLHDAMTPSHREPFAATSAIVDTALAPAAVSAAVAAARIGLDVPNLVGSGISFDTLGGAVADVAPSDTAFAFRDALATVQYTANWSSGGRDPAPFDTLVRKMRSALTPWTGPSAYVNYADPQITNYGTAYWGANYSRLQSVKRQVDPHSVFTFPQAVKP